MLPDPLPFATSTANYPPPLQQVSLITLGNNLEPNEETMILSYHRVKQHEAQYHVQNTDAQRLHRHLRK